MLDFEALRAQIVGTCCPDLVLLFGSQAKGTATDRSDVDLCVVAQTEDKRGLLTQLYCRVESEKPIDFLLYTPEEWAVHVKDPHSFAYKINREGVRLEEFILTQTRKEPDAEWTEQLPVMAVSL